MNVTHQKNILHLSTAEERCTGTSIFNVDLEKDEPLEILKIQLKILKIEVLDEDNWKVIEEIESPVVPKATKKIRILFEIERNNPGISFYSTPDKKHMEFVGEPVNGQAQVLFPLLSVEVFTIEMVYIVSSEKGFQVASSGVLSGIYDGGTTKMFHYKIENGRPKDVVFAGGMFEEMQSGRVSILVPEMFSNKFSVGRKECFEVIKSSIVTAQQALDYKLPFCRLQVVFTLCNVVGTVGRNCAVLNISQMIVPEAIDQCFSSIKTLTKIVAEQYFGIFAYSSSDLDEWIYTGLAEHVSMYLIEVFLGVNEMKYELNRNIDYVHKKDIEEAPLSSASRARSTFRSEFFIKKSSAFIKILENNLTRAFMQKIMKEVLELRSVTTQDLIRIVKGITGKDVRMLFEAYVYKAGIPTVVAQVEQNSRAGGFSIMLKQKIHSVHPEANRNITGNICIRVYESDSVLDHVLFIGSTPITHELACNQRSQRRKQKGEEAASLLWVRIDPGLEWMKVSAVEQADYMFAEQLVSEKDVYGQMEALAGVQKNPSETICGILERVMGDPQIFYKVSIAAGVLLAKSVNEESGYFGFQRVVQYFINSYCIQNTTIVKTNDFSQYRMYFMQKNIAASMSLCQLDSTKVLSGRTIRAKNVVSAFLLNLMRYNDNTGNNFEDSFYLADIITSLSIALCSDAYLDASPFVMEMERLRKKDLLFPSHQNVITCATIKAFTRLGVQGHVAVSLKGMLEYTMPENFYKVRMAAYECIIMLHCQKLDVVLEMARYEERIVRIKILAVIRDSIKCAALPVFEEVKKHLPAVQKIGSEFAGDENVENLVQEIESLLLEQTELASDLIEEIVLHDLSSDEEAKTVPRVVFKIFKPLLLRIPLSPLRALEQAPEPEPVEAQPVHVPVVQVNVDDLYAVDVHRSVYCLGDPQKTAAYHFLSQIKKNKSTSHILQASKKVEAASGGKIPTFEDIVIAAEHASPEEEREGSQNADEKKEKDSATKQPSENREKPKEAVKDISITISHTKEEELLGNPVRCLFNASDEYPMVEIYNKSMCIFREYFKYAQYDTSMYNTIKYFQAHFEREYTAFFQSTDAAFHRVDAETVDGACGREVLLEVLDKIMQEDTHAVFSVPISTDLLKEYKYMEIVRRPLDLLTIRTSLAEKKYLMVECVIFDIFQVFLNCMAYNLPNSEIYNEAVLVKQRAEQVVSQIEGKFTEKCTLKDALRTFVPDSMEQEFALFFEKVNKDKYPQYYSVVKEPMSLSVVKERIEDGYYKNIVHFESDIQKINSASIAYNGALSDITKLSKILTQRVQGFVQSAFPWYKSIFSKRSFGAQQRARTGPASSKKAKLPK
ncbi:transcription initiation factor TFIID subunit 2 [Nematocida major]|uniref:transcription initiation factor TFIID subunit 2 n=1 Tax=Nematocida major TaxID=1912982 RepID=UPI00200873CF|nr:transcription initiation factor TFIID subunit 2 [Nematocida major]KAH9385249.1 transcription initiation factor TFIID subunit 2 [Nematocida major]